MGLSKRLLEKAAASQLDEADPSALRDYYQSVLDSVGSVIYTVNRDLRITGVNEQWDHFALANGGAHLMRAHILGSHLLDQMQGLPLERWRTVCRQLLDGELPRYLDEVATEEPYAWRYYALRATPLRDSQGAIQGITFVASNITQLKKAENEMFRRLVEIRGLRQVAQTAGAWVDRRKVYGQITADVAHLFGADKCVIFFWDEQTGNLQAREPAFGLSGPKLANLSLDLGHPTDPHSLWLDLEEKDYILLNAGDIAQPGTVAASAGAKELAAMLGILRVSGRILGAILVAGRDHPFSDQEGQLLALFAAPTALSIENDELSRRLLERSHQLTTTQEQLGQAIKMSEAARTPLSVIRGYLELLRDGAVGPVPEAQLSKLNMVLDQTQTIASLVNRMPSPTYPDNARRYEQICLVDLMRTVLGYRLPAIKRAGIDLVTQLPVAHDPESVTLGDPELLFRAFDTLLDNLIKISADGATLHVSLQASDGVVYVKVADSGIGIPADELLHVWKSPKHLPSPTPINLSEVKRIVEAHGGQVWVDSPPGQRSTFHVVLRKLDP
jgi:signal transduction histidine kinase